MKPRSASFRMFSRKVPRSSIWSSLCGDRFQLGPGELPGGRLDDLLLLVQFQVHVIDFQPYPLSGQRKTLLLQAEGKSRNELGHQDVPLPFRWERLYPY